MIKLTNDLYVYDKNKFDPRGLSASDLGAIYMYMIIRFKLLLLGNCLANQGQIMCGAYGYWERKFVCSI